MRKLATIRDIGVIVPIAGADAIEAAVIGGWKVVIRKGDYQVGDRVIYCEIDSWIPHERAPFLSKGKEPSEYEGVKGERLRTVKLRGQVSQGLLLPMSNLTNYGADLSVGDDVTEQLGILKWEAPVPANLSGDAVGLFPIFIPKTDQERIQNLTNELHDWSMKENTWEVTEKLDGSSMTVFVNGDESGVCSRNLQLKESEGNSLWVVTNRESLIEKVKMTRRNLALQGEIIGEGIQGNSYKLRGQDFFLFDVYDIDERRYLIPWERRALADKLCIKHVPVIKTNFALESALSQDIVYMAEGKSSMCEVDPPEREGIVFKRDDGEASFKAISNKFLMKNGA